LKKLGGRSIQQTITIGEGDDAKTMDINVPHMSLSNFCNSEGQEFEPEALGVDDVKREEAESIMFFEEMMVDMYKEVCKTVNEYKALNHMLNTKVIPDVGGCRRRKAVSKIAEITGTTFKQVEMVAERVRPWIERHDFVPLLSTYNFKAPPPEEIFEEEDLDKYFEDNEGEDVWTLLSGNV
jgi:hypothetical protein